MIAAFRYLLCILAAFLCAHCNSGPQQPQAAGSTTLIFRHGKIAKDPKLLRAVLDRYEQQNPGIKIVEEVLPASTDEQHQLYVINLQAESDAFDLLAMDIIWIQEFAKAGWLVPLAKIVQEEETRDYFKGVRDALMFEGRPYAAPWFVDAGILYYRKDLLRKHELAAPKTWQELVHAAGVVRAADPKLAGFVWQGKQYEGLVCNLLEFMHGNGGDILRNGESVIDSAENREALTFARDLIHKWNVSPQTVTTFTEEPARHLFQQGRAVFLRNWPYAWELMQAPGSPVRGKVGVAPLPAFAGHASAATLGGWMLGVNRFSHNREAALKLVQFLTSRAVLTELNAKSGLPPPFRSLYATGGGRTLSPLYEALGPALESAVPRPPSPYYSMISQLIQPELSAVIAGIRGVEETLPALQKKIAFVLGEERR